MPHPSKTILVVEDEKSLMEIITLTLENYDFNVIKAYSVREAINVLQETKKIHAVWLDHYLNGENGVEIVTTMKNDPRFKKTPIFLISNTATETNIYNYIQLGVKKYFVKTQKSLDTIVKEIKKFL